MPNTTGRNQFGQGTSPFEKEKPYGAAKQMDQLARSAVMAGSQGASSAINAPRRAQRQQVRGGKRQAERQPQPGTEPLVPQPAPPPELALPFEVRVLARWEQAAATPDASPETRRMLERARKQAGQSG